MFNVAHRLGNFDVRVGGLNEVGTLCHHEAGSLGAGWAHLTCPNPLPGRQVTVQIVGPNPVNAEQILTLCEVQVMAQGKYSHM